MTRQTIRTECLRPVAGGSPGRRAHRMRGVGLTAVAVAAAVVLAGCGSSGGTGSGTSGSSTASGSGGSASSSGAGSSTSGAATSESASASGSGSASGAGSASGSASASGSGSTSGSASGSASGGSAPQTIAEPTSPVTITFMEAMSSGSQKSALAKMVSDFHAAHPKITVQLQEQPDYGTLYTKISAAAAAGNAPTIAQVYEEWAAELAANDVIMPLTSYASKAELSAFYPGIKNDLYLPDGKLWMWPFNKSVVIQYYNQNLLKAAGINAAPTTWAEFATDAKKVSKGKVVAISIDPGNSSGPQGGTAWYEILAQSFGSPVFAKDGTPQFTSKAAVQALQYLVDLKKAGALATGTNYPGQTALGAQTGVWDISSVASYPYNLAAVGKKFTMGTAALPKGTAGPANQLAGTNIAMFASASKAQQDAAWIFLQFLTSPKEQAYWASQTGYLPLGPAALQQPDLQNYVKDHPYVTFASKDLSFATGLPPYSWVTKASGDLAEGLQAALNGSKSPQDALADAQSQAMKDKQAAG